MKTYSLTNQQKSILDIIKLNGTSILNISGAVIYNELYDTDIINKAINIFLYRNDGYRVRIVRENGEDRQYINPYNEEIFEIKKFRNMEEFTAFANKTSRIPINIYNNKLYKFYILQIGNISGVLAIASHIITDGMSYALLCQQVRESIININSGNEPCMDCCSYVKHILDEEEYNRSDKCLSDGIYWRGQLSDGITRTAIKADMGIQSLASERLRIITDKADSNLIKKVCRENNISEAVLFEAAFLVYLRYINGDISNISIGVSMLNRKNRYERNTAGLFQSTLPMIINIAKYNDAAELFSAIKSKHREMFKHTRYSAENINSFIREKGESNIYDVLVSYQGSNVGDNEFETLWFSCGYNEEMLSFHIDCRDSSIEYAINIDYNIEMFDEYEIRLLYNRIIHIIKQLGENRQIDNITVLPDKERELLLSFNDTLADFDKSLTVTTAVENSIKKYGDKIAFVYNDISVSYSKLDHMANTLAAELVHRGVGRNDAVAIITEKNQFTIVAMIAVLKSGGAYVLIDGKYPKARTDYIINECRCKAVLISGLDYECDNAICLDSFDYDKMSVKVENTNLPEDICYINYTSGSTGNPKGIAVKHIGVINYSLPVEHNLTVCEAFEKDLNKIISVTSVIFDIFAFEVLTALINGWSIYLLNDEQSSDTRLVAEYINRYNIDILQTTPTKMKLYAGDGYDMSYLKQLKQIVLIGEVFSKVLYNRLRSLTDCSIYNNYGPAETTVWSTNSLIKDRVNIGRPIANTSVYIIDNQNNIVPVGVAGELCIGGLGVSRGYINNDIENNKRFVTLFGNRVYKTGDRGYYRSDGNITYLNRLDSLIKIRGLRVELSEIEKAAGEYDGIELCAVTYNRSDTDREYMVCYYTAVGDIDENKLRTYMAGRLPKYMLPNYFMRIDNMPLTPSGKLCRSKLPHFSNVSDRLKFKPKTENEKILCDIFKEVLELDEVGVNESFLELGGDSLSALKLIALAESKGLYIPYAVLYEAHSVREICDRIG